MTALACCLAIVALSVAFSPTAHAWGADGHRLIAELAEAQLTPVARAEVNRLLAMAPGATMAVVSTWADEVRRPGTALLHYVNLPEGSCEYERQRDCPDGRCVVEAITRQAAILKSAAPDVERLAALKWLIHLVGDIHQPLHVGLASDKGGNLSQVRAFGRGSNLHAVWDAGLIKRRPGGAAQLGQDVAVKAIPTAAHTDPARWATESCQVRRRPGFYPQDRLIYDEYAEQWDTELVNRISVAGARLAATLNEALGVR